MTMRASSIAANKDGYTVDGLVNALTGSGTAVDRRMGAFYAPKAINHAQVLASYRDSWLMRKIVDLPPKDMTRAGREWQGDKAVIGRIEQAEKRWKLWAKVKAGLVLGRLGGGALIIGLGDGSPAKPLPDDIGKDALKYLHLVSRHELTLGEFETDLTSEHFGAPKYFRLNGAEQGAAQGPKQGADIHPSRVITFHGAPVAHGNFVSREEAFWGDPIYRSVIDAVQNADTALGGFAALVDEAKIDVFLLDLVDALQKPNGEALVQQRLNLVNMAKSIHRALILDKDDKWEQKQISWAGMPEVAQLFLATVASAADIPATRFLGKSPDGMNATGDGDERNYHAMIATAQEDDLRFIIEALDAVILPSEGISLGDDDWWQFAPLSKLSESEQADVDKKRAETAKIYAESGAVPMEALSAGVVGRLIEDGTYPGLEAAMAELAATEAAAAEGEAEAEEAGAGEAEAPKSAFPKSQAPKSPAKDSAAGPHNIGPQYDIQGEKA